MSLHALHEEAWRVIFAVDLLSVCLFGFIGILNMDAAEVGLLAHSSGFMRRILNSRLQLFLYM